jgi:L-fuconolactonase
MSSTQHAASVDTHQHFWCLERGDYGWLTPALPKLYRDFGPEDLEPALRRCGIQHTVLVQAAPTVNETRYLLDLARDNPFIAGVVGWVDFESPQLDVLDRVATDAKLVGLRPMVQDIADPQWLLKASLKPTIDLMVERGLTFDALVRPFHLPILRWFCELYPSLIVVLDHAGKPNIASDQFDEWALCIEQLAADTAVYCKFSGLVTEAGRVDAAQLRPYVDHLFASFGASRILWGSDWPVCESVCSYEEWHDLSRQLTSKLEPADCTAVFGGNAQRAYRLALATTGVQ